MRADGPESLHRFRNGPTVSTLAALPATQTATTSVQYLIGLVLVGALLVASLASLMQCQSRWVIRWPRLGRLGDLLLTADPEQREYILRHLVGAANCLAGLGALNYGVTRGVVDPEPCRWLTASALGTTAVFYTMIRAGVNRQMDEPSLVGWQTLCASLFLAWGYYLGGPCKPVALILLIMMLLFCVFNTTPRVLMRTGVAAAIAFGGVMARIAYEERQVHNGPEIQMVYFVVLIILLISCYLMAQQHARLRALAHQRKQELSQALDRIQIEATRDDLTGLHNRRHMLAQLKLERHRCIRTGRGFCLALIDIDHFKQINDTHGHGTGDEVLRQVATSIEAGLREIDLVARWGGEEFLVMFTDTDCDTAEQVLGRILVQLGGLAVCTGHPDVRVSFSAGVTAFAGDEPLHATIDRADRALYLAKAEGRHCIRRALPPPAPLASSAA